MLIFSLKKPIFSRIELFYVPTTVQTTDDVARAGFSIRSSDEKIRVTKAVSHALITVMSRNNLFSGAKISRKSLHSESLRTKVSKVFSFIWLSCVTSC